MPTLKRMANCGVWDVVKVPFPHADRPVRQRRPALVVARQPRAGVHVLVWVLMVTSAQHRRWEGDVEVSDRGIAGLPAPSVVRTAKLATVDERDTEPLGTLPIADRAAVRAHLAHALAEALAQ